MAEPAPSSAITAGSAADADRAPGPPQGSNLGRTIGAIATGMADNPGSLRFAHLVPVSSKHGARHSLVPAAPLPPHLLDDEPPAPEVVVERSNQDGNVTEVAAAAAAADAVESNDRRHRRDTILTTAIGLGTYALSLVTGPLLARSLGASARGSYQAVWAPTQIIGWLLMIGVPAATTFYIHEERRRLEATGWLITAFIGLPVCAVIWPLVPIFLQQHPPSTIAWFRAFLLVGLLVLPMQNTYEYLRAQGDTWKFNIYRSLSLVLSTIFIVALYVVGRLDLTGALAVTWAANVIAPVGIIVYERAWPRALRRVDRRLIRQQLHYGGRIWFGTLSNMVLARFDQFLMVGLVAPTQLGLYAIAVTAAGLSAPVAQGVGFALFPFLRRDDDPVARAARARMAMWWVGAGSLLICGALALLAPWGIPALMGEAFRASLPAFFILLPGQIFWNLGIVVKTALEADGRPGAGSKSLFVAALITVVGVPIAVPYWGIEGAAVVTSASQAAFLLSGMAYARRPREGAGEDDVRKSELLTGVGV